MAAEPAPNPDSQDQNTNDTSAPQPEAASDATTGSTGSEPTGMAQSGRAKPDRLVSLDAFRGLTILGMLLVNNLALDVSTPKYLTHAPWNSGVYIADLVFPWFLLIVGVAIPYAAASAVRRGLRPAAHYWRVLKRSVSLILLGILLDSSISKTPIIGLGVLQVIGLSYLFGSLLYRLSLWPRIAITAALLLAHWAAIRFIPIPGLGTGVFAENRNLISYVNRMYLQAYHLNGLLSVVTTTAMVLIGTMVGDFLRRSTHDRKWISAALLGVGAVLAAAGYAWNIDLPFNKPLWTSSYIVFTAGLGLFVLGVFYFTIDAKGWRAWAFPLVVFGMNAIVAYVLPILVKVYILQEWNWRLPNGTTVSIQQALLGYMTSHAGRVTGGWLYTATYIVVWWLVLFILYRKRIFLRV